MKCRKLIDCLNGIISRSSKCMKKKAGLDAGIDVIATFSSSIESVKVFL
jgi:hypothetical protein